ncbi:MAG: right-handed parallel beta-helix repeat-containing protein [Bacteroidota bacterium]
MKNEVDLNLLKPGNLDLSDYGTHVHFKGRYEGDRIVIDSKSASGKTLVFKDATIISTRTAPDKDAIAFRGELKNCKIHAENGRLIYGGLTFWNRLENVTISGLQIFYPNAGIKASQDFPNANVTIEHCVIVGAQREGIYFGPHHLQKVKSNNVNIRNNWIVAPGWDGIQGNALNLRIHDNLIEYAAMLQEPNQDYPITVQAGSDAYVWNNQIITQEEEFPKGVQGLDCRIFDHPPKNNN